MADKKRHKRAPALLPRPYALLYCILLLLALVFTQVLRNTASAVFFWFLVLAPLLSFLLLMIGRASVQVYVSSDTNRCEKMAPVEYEIRVINASPLPLPFVEAVINHWECTVFKIRSDSAIGGFTRSVYRRFIYMIICGSFAHASM